jgi:hypothetical protein
MGIWPEIPPEEPESFRCPECDDPVDRVSIQMGTAIAEHEDGRQHEIDHSDFQEWRQGESHFYYYWLLYTLPELSKTSDRHENTGDSFPELTDSELNL